MFSILHCINSVCNFKMINIILFILNNLYDIYIYIYIYIYTYTPQQINYQKIIETKTLKEDSKLQNLNL